MIGRMPFKLRNRLVLQQGADIYPGKPTFTSNPTLTADTGSWVINAPTKLVYDEWSSGPYNATCFVWWQGSRNEVGVCNTAGPGVSVVLSGSPPQTATQIATAVQAYYGFGSIVGNAWSLNGQLPSDAANAGLESNVTFTAATWTSQKQLNAIAGTVSSILPVTHTYQWQYTADNGGALTWYDMTGETGLSASYPSFVITDGITVIRVRIKHTATNASGSVSAYSSASSFLAVTP